MPRKTQKTVADEPSRNLTAKKRAFLAAYAESGNITLACKAAGVVRRTHYDWLASDDKYKETYADAQSMAAEMLEAEARRRAAQGVHRLKFHQGMPIMVPCPSGDWECAVGHRGPRGERSEVGWECPVCETPQHPVMVPYVEHEYSDTLLIFLLKGAMPKKYRENVDITSGDEPLKALIAVDLEKI